MSDTIDDLASQALEARTSSFQELLGAQSHAAGGFAERVGGLLEPCVDLLENQLSVVVDLEKAGKFSVG